MSWNYRVLKRECLSGESVLAIHEVYYDEDGEAISWTEGAAHPQGATLQELRDVFDLYAEAIEPPVLDEALLERETGEEEA